jgi:hypothetical protein
LHDIEELKRQGFSVLAISELTGYDRKTVRKYLLRPEGVPAYPERPVPRSKLDGFKPYLEERLKAGVWNAVVLLRELKERNYKGGYTILTDWLRPQRQAAGRWRCGGLRHRRAGRRKWIGDTWETWSWTATSASYGASPSPWATAG